MVRLNSPEMEEIIVQPLEVKRYRLEQWHGLHTCTHKDTTGPRLEMAHFTKLCNKIRPCSPFSDQDRSLSTQCTLMTENECWISFSVVAGETGTTAYNLQIYGGPCVRADSR